MNHQGWIGLRREVLYYLSTVNADKDPDGNYLLTGPEHAAPFTGLNGDEVVIAAECSYLVNGERKNLAAGLRSTSMGVKVAVF
jgi:hypothetical protein